MSALKIISRAEWGARPPDYVNRGDLSDASTCHWNGPTITVGGKTTWDHSRCAGLVRGIQNYHMDAKGWSDIAYNFVECPHGYTFEGRGLNVWNGANGTNTGNRRSHAICCLAGEGNPFPEAEKVGFKACVRHIYDRTNAPNRCKGHRDHKATTCPGDDRYNWVHANMPVNTSPEIPEELPVFKNTKEAQQFVEESYERIVGRKVESVEVRDSHAFFIMTSNGTHALRVITGLLYERRLREDQRHKSQQNAINKLRATVDDIDVDQVPVLTEDQILATVYKDLAEKIAG